MEGGFSSVILRDSTQIIAKQGKEINERGDEAPVPKVGMTFVSEKEMREYCTKYAESVGFDIAKRSTKCGDDGKQRYFSLACSRKGQTISASNTSFYPKSSSKTNCKAKINVAIKGDNGFVITRVFLDHNHELTPGKARYFRYNKVFKPYTKRKLDLNEIAGRNLNSIWVEAGEHENVKGGEKEAKKHRVAEEIQKPQLERGDPEALLNFFSRMQAIDPSFFYAIDVDEENRIRNVFWSDPRCRAAYESFSDVVSLDTSYLTSRYSLPLASFVGVNHHGQSILLGCALIFSEATKTMIWLFKSWLTCMRGRHPKTLVSDAGKPIQIAVAEVFPNSTHCLCLRSIMDKVPARLGGLPKCPEIERAIKNAVYDSFTCDEFEQSWRKTIDEYGLKDNEWLKSLYEDRKYWVPAYVKFMALAGISTTQKIETENPLFEDFVRPKTTLREFLESYDEALERNIEKENNADFVSSSFLIPTMINHPLEKQLQKVYANDIFKLFHDEWRGLIFCNASLPRADGSIIIFEVAESVYNKDGMFLKQLACEVLVQKAESQLNCSCRLFDYKGILCRHIFSVFIKCNVCEIPPRYILKRWRKDVERRHKNQVRRVSYNDVSNERRWYDELSPLLFDVQQLSIQSKEQCELLKKELNGVKQKLVPTEDPALSLFYLINYIMTFHFLLLTRKVHGHKTTSHPLYFMKSFQWSQLICLHHKIINHDIA